MDGRRIAPYTKLRIGINKYLAKIFNRKKENGVYFSKASDQKNTWNLSRVYEMTRAADQLGFNVVLSVKGENLHVDYVEKLPERRWF